MALLGIALIGFKIFILKMTGIWSELSVFFVLTEIELGKFLLIPISIIDGCLALWLKQVGVGGGEWRLI